MRNPLFKRIPRILRKDRTKHLGLFVMLTVTILAGTSFNVVLDDVTRSLEVNDEICLVEDGEFEVAAPVSEAMEEYFEENNIILAPNYYFKDENWDGNSTLLVFDDKDMLNNPVLFEGSLPRSDKDIVFDRIALEKHNLGIGDSITLSGEDYVVSGTVAFTDYTSLFKSNSDLVMNTETFGVAMLSSDGFAKLADSDSVVYRYSYRYENRNMTEKELFEADTDIQKKLISNGESALNFITKENNQSISFLPADMGSDGPTMKIFVLILEVIIAFIFVILTNDSIDREAQIIGTLRSLGYKKSEILMHYLLPTFAVTCLAAIVGNVLAYTVMIEPFKNFYYTTYSVPPISAGFSIADFALSTIAPIVIIIAINYLLIRSKLSLNPLKFLRHDLKKGRQKKAVKLPNLKFFSRFRLRIIWENKGNYLLLFLGIFLASFLLLFGIGFKPMFDRYESSLNETLNYDYQYILKAPYETDGGEKLLIYEMNSFNESLDKDIEILFYGIEDNSSFFDIDELPEYENEIVISAQVKGKMGLEVGDSLFFKDAKYDKEYRFYVSGECDHDSSMAVFMKRELLIDLLDKDTDYFNAYVSNRSLDIDEKYILKKITRNDMLGAATQMLSSFETVIDFVKYFSILIYFVMMYILTKIIVEKNALSISFLKVFGYNNKEIGKVYLNASTNTVLLSLILCIPLEVLAVKGVMRACMSMVDSYFRIDIPIRIYLYVVMAGIVTYFAVNGIHVGKIKKIPGCEALKNRD